MINLTQLFPNRFNEDGLLPPKDYPLTFGELRQSILVNGVKGGPKTWDRAWRAELVNNLEILVRQLWKVGIETIFIDGSFVEDKDHPNDIDGYFECDKSELDSGKVQRELNLFDGDKIWTWDVRNRRAHPDFERKQLPMWHIYRVELYPHFGQGSGIKDAYGNEFTFPSAFRQTRDHKPKGIVKILRG